MPAREHATLYEYLRICAAEAPERPLLGDKNGWLTAREVLTRVDALAVQLRERGVAPGELVAVRCVRTVPVVLGLLALEALGAAAVLTDPHRTAEDALAQCDKSIPVKAVLDDTDGTLTLTDRTTQETAALEPERACAPFTAPEIDPNAPGFVIFTSGSTARSKAVVLSRHNAISCLVDAAPLGDYRPDDIALGAIPLEHVFGLVLLTGVLVLGYGLYLTDKIAPAALAELIEEQKITRMNGVPALYLAIAASRGERELSSLRCGFLGGGPCTAEQLASIEEALGMTLIPVYGMSECSGIACASAEDPRELRAGCVGRFYPTVRARFRRDDGGEAAPGEEGELWVDGPTRMLGYYGEEPLGDGLFPTGDLGFVDENGIVHLTGRKKEIIIRSGVNLSPCAIEKALLSVPGVTEAAVVGLGDPLAGELPWAMAVCTPDAPADLSAALSERLPKNQIPAGILRADALPRTPSGKPDRVRIREVLNQWKAS